MTMLKPSSKQISIAVGSGLACVVLFGTVFAFRQQVPFINNGQNNSAELADESAESEVFQLALLEEKEVSQLETIANQSQVSRERNRARYLLADELIATQDGETALTYLEGLEADYPLLAPHILFKRLQALELAGETETAQETLSQLQSEYPDSPIVAEALYWQGESQPEYLDRVIAEFPTHPRAVEIARQRLAQNPQQLDLLLLVIRADPYGKDTAQLRDRATTEYASQLTPADWEVIASGYWETWQYRQAGTAYQQAGNTPKNLYRTARALQLSGEQTAAKSAYTLLFTTFPDAQENELGLSHLASLSTDQEAIPHLDTLIQKFPNQAAQALSDKAKRLESLNSKESAQQARASLLSQYPEADATAEYRWQVAQNLAEQGQLESAVQWIEPILRDNRTSEITPKAGFWGGKWARQIGQQQEAKAAFENVLTYHPESYYAWRSAVHLGLDVGDFNNVRSILPEVNQPQTRTLPPAGSEAFQELYRLGQDEEAFAQWQAESQNTLEPTIEQQFTDGLIRQAIGQNLQGINRIWLLQHRDKPEDAAEFENLRETREYWQALFPFPYNSSIINWSEQRQLNPLLVTSLIRQESRFEKDISSFAGASGLMQVMPATGEWVANAINLSDYSLTDVEDNINIGTWYLDYTHREYENNSLLAVASYNAGPGNVANWLKKYNTSDPDSFVEQIPFPETKGYVESVFGNYWNYLQIYNPEVAEMLAQYQK